MDEPEKGLAQTFEEAVTLHERGLLPEAARRYRAILELHGDHFGSLHHLAMLRAEQGDLDEALRLLRRAIVLDPTDGEVQNHVGSVLHALGRPEEALAHFQKALLIDQEHAEAHYNLGNALQALGQHDEAIASFEAALALEPVVPAAHYGLGMSLQALKRTAEAIECFRKALAIDPGYASAHAALGAALQTSGSYDAAIAHYAKAVAINPRSADVYERLGTVLHQVRRYQEAIECYRKALAIDPEDADAHNNLGLALQALDRHGEAVAHHEKALALRPEFGAAHNNLGRALQALNRHEEAIAQYRKAIAAGPPHASRYGNLGVALQEIGRLEEACLAFQQAIQLAPTVGQFYRNLADCKRFTVGDPQLTMIEQAAQDRASLPEQDRRQLLFALAKAFADIGEYDRSFACLLEGNALKRAQIKYDEDKALNGFARIKAVFTADMITRRQGLRHPSSVPIFILGMPRSGTTLVEQILASHTRIFGAGELATLPNLVAHLKGVDETRGLGFPELVPQLSGEQLREIGAEYVDMITQLAPTAWCITDKMPLNFFFAGLIHLVLPNARIIHTRRDPVDTCFSCFATLFTGNHNVAYELGELGRYYRAYDALMEHWRRVLPPGVMLDVQYEALVANPESEARKIVAHCRLEWEEACLSFHATERPVRTASVAQVRQPIYGSSIGRWRQYAHLLQPLLDALAIDNTAGVQKQR